MKLKGTARNKIKHTQKETKNIFQWIYLLGILLLTILVYSKSIKNDFIRSWDDNLYILQNEIIKDTGFENVKTIFSSIQIDNYSPITTLILAIEYSINGPEPLPFHVTSLIFHILNILLVYFFIHRLTGKRNVSLITTLLFAVHPMFVESVVWIPAQSSIICSIFSLVTLIFYVDYVKSAFKIKYLVISFIFFLLSLMSKSITVTLPFLLILIDYFLRRRFSFKIIYEKIPFFALSILFGIIAIRSLGSYFIGDITDTGFSFIDKIFFSGYLIVVYTAKLLIPFKLSALHYYPEQSGVLPFEYYIVPLFIILIIFGIFKSGRFKKQLIFGFLFYVISISIVLPLFSYRQTIFAERYLYTAYIGLFVIIGLLYDVITSNKSKLSRKQKSYFITVLTVLTLFYSVYSYNRTKVWENGVTLFTDVVEKYPNHFKGYGMLGVAKTIISDLQGALSTYEKGLALNPDHKLSIMNLAFVKSKLNDHEGAIQGYTKLIEMDYKKSKIFLGRGIAKCKLKNYTGGIEDFNKAIEIDPDMAINYENRGVAYNKLKQYEEAIKDFDKAIEIDPDYTEAYDYRGLANFKMENFENARIDFNNAIRTNTNYIDAYNNMGILLARMENYKEALEYFNKAILINPKHADAYKLRGNIYFVYNNIKEACKDWNKAYELGDKSIIGLIKQNCK